MGMIKEANTEDRDAVFNLMTIIEESVNELDKAFMLLGELRNNYDSDKALDLRKGLDCWDHRLLKEDEGYAIGELTAKVCHDYHKIATMVRIIDDYVAKARKDLTEAVQM